MPHSVASKAHLAAALLQRYQQLHNDAEKSSTISMLNEVFPNIRFRHRNEEGLMVFYLQGATTYKRLPKVVTHVAGVIVEVRSDGQGEVLRDRIYGPGLLFDATELLVELGGEVPRKSRWEILGAEEDWI